VRILLLIKSLADLLENGEAARAKGGILGNFLERIVHHHVTDFIEVYWQDYFRWPTFNLADTAITCGVLFILYESFMGEESETSEQ